MKSINALILKDGKLEETSLEFPNKIYPWTGMVDSLQQSIYHHSVLCSIHDTFFKDQLVYVEISPATGISYLRTIHTKSKGTLTLDIVHMFKVVGHLTDIELHARFVLEDLQLFLIAETLGYESKDKMPPELIPEYENRLKNILTRRGLL